MARPALRRAPPLALLAVAMACEARPVAIEVPFAPGDASALVALEHRGLVELVALDAGDRDRVGVLALFRDVDDRAPLDVTAVLFDRPLVALSLPAGALALDPSGVAVPTSARMFGARSVGGAVSWAPLDGLPSTLRDLRVAPSGRCATLSPAPAVELAEHRVVAGLLSLGGRPTIAVGSTLAPGLDLLRVGADGTLELASRLELPVHVLAAAVDERGQLFLSGFEAGTGEPAVWWRRPDAALEPLAAFTALPRPRPLLRWIAPDTGQLSRLFGLSPEGALVRLDTDSTDALVASVASAPGGAGALAVAGPGHLLVVRPDATAMERWERGSTSREVTEVDPEVTQGRDRVLTVAVTPGGVFAGSQAGVLLELDAVRRWRRVEEPVLLNSSVRAIAGFDGSVLVGGLYGRVQQYLPARGAYCRDPVFVGQNTEVTGLLVQGDFAVATGLAFDLVAGSLVRPRPTVAVLRVRR